MATIDGNQFRSILLAALSVAVIGAFEEPSAHARSDDDARAEPDALGSAGSQSAHEAKASEAGVEAEDPFCQFIAFNQANPPGFNEFTRCGTPIPPPKPFDEEFNRIVEPLPIPDFPIPGPLDPPF
jgi:hypothetical protein